MPSTFVPNVSALVVIRPRSNSNFSSFIGRPLASFGVVPFSGAVRHDDRRERGPGPRVPSRHRALHGLDAQRLFRSGHRVP